MSNIIENTLLMDNISEALNEMDGSKSHSMLVCHVFDGDDNFQVHIKVTRNEKEFIDDNEEMPELNYIDERFSVIQ